jgi:hypothetical protein
VTGTSGSPTRTPFDASTSNKPTEKVDRSLAPPSFRRLLSPRRLLFALISKFDQSSTTVEVLFVVSDAPDAFHFHHF